MKLTVTRRSGRDPGAVLDEILERRLSAIADRASDNWARGVPVDTGDYRDSIQATLEHDGEGVRIKVASSEPAELVHAIEEGREPGAPMPPPGSLDDWEARHGIPPEADFPVRRSVGEKGTEGAHAAEQAARDAESDVRLEREAIKHEIASALNNRK